MRILFVAALYVSSLFAHPTTHSTAPSAARREEYVNEHHQNWLPTGRSEILSRDIPADIKAQIDAAVDRTRHLTHYFWTGTLPPHASRDDSVESYARRSAALRSGTTLEDTLIGVPMPTWSQQDPQSQEVWQYASREFAMAAQGEVFVFMGERVRSDNVWITQEWPRLYVNPNVPRMYRILVHLTSEEIPHLIFDRLNLPIDFPDHPPPPAPGPPPPPAPPAPPVAVDEKNSNVAYAAARACRTWSSEGGYWYREDNESFEDITWQVASYGSGGFYYGGALSEKNAGAFTYSMVVDPTPATKAPSRSEMFDWLKQYPTFDARFASPQAYEPSEINYGTGWIPYATACPWNLGTEHLSNVKLRALPVGDGLTAGMRNYQGGKFMTNGYRYDLQQVMGKPFPRRIIHQQGNPGGPIRLGRRQDNTGGPQSAAFIDFIGHTKSGDMEDSDNEGHPGAHISDLDQYIQPVIDERPNIVFLMAGTNDMTQDDDVAGAPARLMKLVDRLSDALPDAAILVATVPVLGKDDQEGRANAYNAEINKLLLRRAADGRHVLAVPMENLTVEDLDDGVFPNEHGYAEMAYQWLAGIWQAQAWGWIGPMFTLDTGSRPDGVSPGDTVKSDVASNSFVAGAIMGEGDEGSAETDKFEKWAPAVIGLLAANLFVGLILITFALKGYISRRRSISGTYVPVQTKENEILIPPSPFHQSS